MTELLLAECATDEEQHAPQVGSGGVAGRARGLLRAEALATWVGLALLVVGAVFIAVAWGESSQISVVSRQLPYLMSGGLVGLGLLVVGVTAISLDAKARDSRLRRARADELAASLAAIRRCLEANQ
jgi:uncharacterized membrane protein (Fun14 family)